MAESDPEEPYLQENLWGYGKRLRFVDEAMLREFPGRQRCELSILDIGCGNGSQLTIPLAASGYLIPQSIRTRDQLSAGERWRPVFILFTES